MPERSQQWGAQAIATVFIVMAIAGGVLQAVGLEGMVWVVVTAVIGAPLAVMAAARVGGRDG